MRFTGMRAAAIVILLLTGTAAARYPTFHEPVLSYARLPWTITVDDAVTALTAIGAKPVRSDNRRYEANTAFVSHTTEPQLDFTPRRGWTGHASFDAASRLVAVTVTAELTPGSIKDELAGLASRFGTPIVTGEISRWSADKQTVAAVAHGRRLTVSHRLER